MLQEQDKVDYVDIQHSYNKKDTVFWVFKRNPENPFIRTIEKVYNFYPYFYVDADEDIGVKSLNGLIKIEEGFVTYDGRLVKKLTFKSLEDSVFMSARDKFLRTYEDDIVFLQRFIIDKDIKFEKSQRILYVDIETDNCNTPETPREITSIAVYDSFLKKYITFVWRSDLEHKIVENKNHIIVYYSSEITMMEGFLLFINRNFPTIISGWAIDFFDMPYIINRLKILGLNPNRLSQMQRVFTTINRKTNERYSYIGGTAILDLRQLYKKIVYRKPPDFRLDTVAYVMFGEGKLEVQDAGTLWRDDLDTLIEYNRKDVELCVKIDEHAALIDYFLSIQQIVSVKLEDVFHYSRVIDCHILKKYHGKFVFPSKRRNAKVDFEGGLVIEPEAGLHKNVAIFDASNMYSTIYLQFNLSPETLCDDNSGSIKVNGLSFVDATQKVGLVPQIINELLIGRERFKKLRDEHRDNKESSEYKKYNEVQGAIKGIINSFYGVMGYSNFRLFKPEVSSTITFIGREMIKWCKNFVEQQGLKVIYLDTDGMMVVFPEDFTLEEVVEGCKNIIVGMNKSLDDFVKQFGLQENNYLQMKLEKIFSAMLFTEAKKRYFGKVVYEGGVVDYMYSRGFETSRRDTPLLFKKYLEKVYRTIVELKSESEVRKLCKEIEQEIKCLDVYEIALPVNITKNLDEYLVESQHVKAAKFSNTYLGKDFKQSAVCRLIFVKRVNVSGAPQTDVLLIDRDTDLSGIIVDYDRHIEKLFYQKLQSIFDILKWRMPNDDQQSLSKWVA